MCKEPATAGGVRAALPRPAAGSAADPIALEPVDAVAVTTLVDNVYDALLTGDTTITRAPLAAGTAQAPQFEPMAGCTKLRLPRPTRRVSLPATWRSLGRGNEARPGSRGGRRTMDLGKTHIVVMWTVGPDEVAAGDAVFQSHGKWMEGHSREGGTALLDYSISKGPELANPVDPDSAPTGDTVFVLDEFYASPAGVVEHWRLARDTWDDLSAFMDWTAKAKKVVTLHSGTVVQGLW